MLCHTHGVVENLRKGLLKGVGKVKGNFSEPLPAPYLKGEGQRVVTRFRENCRRGPQGWSNAFRCRIHPPLTEWLSGGIGSSPEYHPAL